MVARPRWTMHDHLQSESSDGDSFGLEAQFLNYSVWGLGSWSVGVGDFSSPLACGLSLILLSRGTFFFYCFFGGRRWPQFWGAQGF